MNILITGAFGFVGTNLSEVLSKNNHLGAIDLDESDKHLYNQFYSWEDLEQINWTKVDAIIHLAGKAHDTKNATAEKVYIDVNVGLTKKIFEFFLKSNASKFIYFSSVKAVADTIPEGDVLTERITPKPLSVYGKSKLKAEKYLNRRLLDYTKEQKDTNVQVITNKHLYILRPTMIHGPGNKGNLNLLYNLVSRGIPWPLGVYNNLRSSTSIDNLKFVISNIIEQNIEPGTYTITDDESLSTNRIVEIIAENKGKKAIIWRVSSKFITPIAKIGDWLYLPLNSDRLKKLTESYVASNKKIKKALKINKMPISAEEGMKQTINSFNKHK